MLDEYFSLSVSDKGLVETLPMLLKGYTPNLDRLPHFLLCLGTQVRSDVSRQNISSRQVNWDDEKGCFETFLRELAFFYSPRPFTDAPLADDVMEKDEEVSHQNWQLEHVLFPSFRRYTAWPRELLVRDVNQVANLPDLFRVFERC